MNSTLEIDRHAERHELPELQVANGHRVCSLNTSVREVSAEQTLAKIEPILADFGVSSVINISLPDVDACPVYQVTRADMRSDYFNAGKGFTPVESKVSGLMEAIEVQCFERADPMLLVPRYPLPEHLSQWSLVSAEQLVNPRGQFHCAARERQGGPLVKGHNLNKQESILLPAEALFLEADGIVYKSASPNGIASGNSVDEASCHALCEMLERHALNKFFLSGGRQAIERVRPPGDASRLHLCLDQLADKNINAEFILISTEADVAVFICFLDVPMAGGRRGAVQGYGAHHAPLIAMHRALAEAIQILALCPVSGNHDGGHDGEHVVITSKQAAMLEPHMIAKQRHHDHLMLQNLRSQLPLVEFEYMALFDLADEQGEEQLGNESFHTNLDKLLVGLRVMGIENVYSAVISPESLPVVVVKCFCPGLTCIDGL
ncbi:YcaO-like family protein [uncultured Microbulbifer sp.]|uniref:YcaO-like family protein n=1 Tax=uncultured Microbulbifer sp. TaxID=348147 RepID=UPI0026323F00|nr:YcaO-like family protein [uncultured Microbulbifer sp.]